LSPGTALALVTHNAAHAQKTSRQLFLREGVLHATPHPLSSIK